MKHSAVYFSVDVETAGPIPGDYSMVSLGLCRVDPPEQTFYAELPPNSKRFVQAALDISGFDLDDLARNGGAPRETMESFSEWA